MRTFTIFSSIAITSVLLTGCTTVSADEQPWDSQPMSMYIWHGCLRDSDFVSRIDFDNYDNVYLMDAAHWSSQEDFDNTIDGILASDGRDYRLSKHDRFVYAIDEAHKAGTKAMMSLGNDMIYGALDPAKRTKMVDALTMAVRNYDFDGIDVDWEVALYPNIDKHTLLLEDLRHNLDSLSSLTGKKYTLSTALSIEAQYPDSLRQRFADAVDWVNLMAYDMGGCLWRRYATHNTPMSQIRKDIDDYWYGIPRSKLHLGLASYGFIYTDLLPGENVADGDHLSNHGRYATYIELAPYLFGDHPWREVRDSVDMMSYYINPAKNDFITVETPESIRHKFEFAREAGLGGAFWWEYFKDIIPDNNGGHKWKHMLVPDHKRKQ